MSATQIDYTENVKTVGLLHMWFSQNENVNTFFETVLNSGHLTELVLLILHDVVHWKTTLNY